MQECCRIAGTVGFCRAIPLTHPEAFCRRKWEIGFLGNLVVPKSLDSGRTEPWPTALAIDLALLALFAIQHSVMARQGFKRVLTRVVPQ